MIDSPCDLNTWAFDPPATASAPDGTKPFLLCTTQVPVVDSVAIIDT